MSTQPPEANPVRCGGGTLKARGLQIGSSFPDARKMLPVALALLLVLGMATSALAQQSGSSAAYDLTSWTVDGGGGTVGGGGYTLSGAAGQPEPGPALSGGGYSLLGGFWSGEGTAAPTPDDTASATPTSTATRLPTVTVTVTVTDTGLPTVTPTATRPGTFEAYLPVILRD